MFRLGRTDGWGREAAALAAALLISMTAAGCTASAATPAEAPAKQSVAATVHQTPAPTPTAAPSATGSPAPAPTEQVAIGPRASGTWTGIRWISDGRTATPDPSGDVVKPTPGLNVDSSMSIFGWSKGYIGFHVTQSWTDASADPPSVSIVAESSVNGLAWTVGAPLPVVGSVVGVGRVVEGPAGLLVVGYGEVAVCGGPATIHGLWLSPDGIEWSSVTPAFGGDSIYSIDAGGAGYIAFGAHRNSEPALWTSTDGRHWVASVPPVSSKTGSVQDATAFSGGFVVVGVGRAGGGCGGPDALTPSIWWSANGKDWTKDKLPGTQPSSDAWMSIARVSDRQLYAMATTNDASTQKTTILCWTSADGRAWQPITAPVYISNIATDGSRAVADTSDEKGVWHIWAFEPDGSIRELIQSGDLPPTADTFDGEQVAMGPAGVVMTDYRGSRFFLGVPTAN